MNGGMEWTGLDTELPPIGQFLLARDAYGDPVYSVARHVSYDEAGEAYIRYRAFNGWKVLPVDEYEDCAWCLITMPEKDRLYKQMVKRETLIAGLKCIADGCPGICGSENKCAKAVAKDTLELLAELRIYNPSEPTKEG